MKSLIVFYSRTGTTKKVAELIAESPRCDIEAIADTKNRKGIIGYLLSGRDAALKRPAKIRNPKKNPASYDLIIIGTPVWAYNMCAPVRAYLIQNQGRIKKAAFFCTMGGSGHERAFREMATLLGKKPVARLGLTTREVAKGHHVQKVKDFVREIKK